MTSAMLMMMVYADGNGGDENDHDDCNRDDNE